MELREYQTCEAEGLTPAQIDALRRANVTVVPSMRSPGSFELTAGSTVGVMQVDGRRFTIRPKIGIRRLLFLLSFAADQSWLRPWLADVAVEDDLLDAMARIYAEVVDGALSRGVRRGYRHREQTEITVRGRIDMGRQLNRHHGRTIPVELGFDDYTIDTDANRILLAAALRLRRPAARSPRAARLLARTVSRLEGVMPLDRRLELPRVTLTRLDEHYRTPVMLARLILGAGSIEPRDGTATAHSMLFDMPRLFEDFVVAGLRAELGLAPTSFPQNGRGRDLQLDLAGRVRPEPDLSWWQDGRCIFVGDVKYKTVGGSGVEHADLYQLLAYATAADLPTAMLIYASGGDGSIVHHIPYAGRSLEVRALDLTVGPSDLRRQLRSIADAVRASVVRSLRGEPSDALVRVGASTTA